MGGGAGENGKDKLLFLVLIPKKITSFMDLRARLLFVANKKKPEALWRASGFALDVAPYFNTRAKNACISCHDFLSAASL
jgi:hypothetical protein